jgi:hypothetical protein
MWFNLKLNEEVARFANALGCWLTFSTHAHAGPVLRSFRNGKTEGAGFEFATSSIARFTGLFCCFSFAATVLAGLDGFLNEWTDLLTNTNLPLARAG